MKQADDFGTVCGDFPLFKRKINGKRIVYLDSAATSQKPAVVIKAMQNYYTHSNANIHRGIYQLSEEATQQYEDAHATIGGFIGAGEREVVFTRNATEAVNLVAYSYGLKHVKKGDNIVVSVMDHHSNFVPWQQLCMKMGADFRVADITDVGEIDMESLSSCIDKRTKIVALPQVSNVFGTIVDVPAVADMAHEKGAVLLVDGAQSVPHMAVDVRKLQCDFLAFSGHKMLGPTGIGGLYGREDILNSMDPFLYGGDMIKQVTKEKTTWNELPWKFEAGTPHIEGGIGLAAAVHYLKKMGMENVALHDKKLLAYTTKRFGQMKDVTIYGDSHQKGGIISFNLRGVHPHDVSSIVASENVCIRAGHHCCQPLMKRLGVAATARASFYVYNTNKDIDVLCNALDNVRRVFRL